MAEFLQVCRNLSFSFSWSPCTTKCYVVLGGQRQHKSFFSAMFQIFLELPIIALSTFNFWSFICLVFQRKILKSCLFQAASWLLISSYLTTESLFQLYDISLYWWNGVYHIFHQIHAFLYLYFLEPSLLYLSSSFLLRILCFFFEIFFLDFYCFLVIIFLDSSPFFKSLQERHDCCLRE